MKTRKILAMKQKIYFAVLSVFLMSEIFITGHIINYEALFRDKYIIAGELPAYVNPGLLNSLMVLCTLFIILIIGIFARNKLPGYAWIIFFIVCVSVGIYSILTAVRSYNFMKSYESERKIMQSTILDDLSLLFNSKESIAISRKNDDCPACISIEGDLSAYFKENNV